MPRPARLRFQRMLAALLWLIASFAFLTRQQDMMMPPDMPGMVGMGATSPVGGPMGSPVSGGPGQLARTAEPAMPMNGPVTAAPEQQARASLAASPSAQAGHEHHTAAAPPAPAPHGDTHAGHCPFCFTAAFALAAFSVELLARPAPRRVAQDRARPAAPRPLAGHKRARAPPFWS